MLKPITINNFLSAAECKSIIDFSLNSLILTQAKIGKGEEKLDKRDSKISFYHYVEFPQLKEKILNKVNGVLQIKGYEINFSKTLQFTEYKENQFYDWHTDIDGKDSNYCSIVIQLNDNYTGGNLEIIENDGIISIPKKAGNLSIFLSEYSHRVSKVESGTRYSLVTWLSLEKQKNYKKTFL